MKDRRMIELTLRCHRCSNRGNDKSSKKQGLDERWERDCNYVSLITDAPIETAIYPKRNKGWSECSGGDWAYLSAMNHDPIEVTVNLEEITDYELEIHEWSKSLPSDWLWIKSNWVNNQSREK